MKARNEYDLIGRNISSEEYLKLESLKIVDGITNVPPQSFRSHPNLRTVNISDSIKYIYSHAFEHCDSLEAISIPNSVVSIGPAFLLDWGLKKLTGSHLIVVLT